jgi:hypothetical protein
MKKLEPQEQHRWLERLVGEWTWEMQAAEPGKPPRTLKGIETVRSLDGVWFIAESQGDALEGGEHRSILTVGYDVDKKRFVGTFISSFMSMMWIYEGELQGDRLVLSSTGPSMTGEGKLAQYHDIIELKGPDERTFTSQAQDEAGKWTEFMRMTYRRRR